MPKQPKEKSAHLQELEAVFDRRTRRFSPFAALGLNRPEQEGVDTQAESATPGSDDPPTHMWVVPTHMASSPVRPFGPSQDRHAEGVRGSSFGAYMCCGD